MLSANVSITVDYTTHVGYLSITGTVDSGNATDRSLTLTAGTGDVTLGGAVGATFDLLSLSITGNDISLARIGGGSAGVTGATMVTATTNGADIGALTVKVT